MKPIFDEVINNLVIPADYNRLFEKFRLRFLKNLLFKLNKFYTEDPEPLHVLAV